MKQSCVLALVAAASLALLGPAEAFHGVRVARVGTGTRRSAFLMSDEPAVAVAEVAEAVVAEGLEETSDEERALQKTRTNKRKRSDKEPTVKLDELAIGSTITGIVRNVVSYGAFVDIGAPKDGMLHVSDISNSFVANISDVLSVGDEITARVKSVDAAAGRFALIMKEESAERGSSSPRPPRQERGQRSKPDLSTLANFDEAEVMRGKVVSVMDFGCFVSIKDNLDGLVHISQLQEGRTNAVIDVVAVGDEVDVRIIGIDTERQRVSLSMLPYSADTAGAYSPSDAPRERAERGPANAPRMAPRTTRDEGAPMQPGARRDPAQRSLSSGSRTASSGSRPQRERRDAGPPFDANGAASNGERAMMDLAEEDAPTLFEHAWISATQNAAAKGIALPADMTA
ncbi:hypothetical protein T492DRAFT_1032151 [Pavlovales sp. CCMP2436]|nr:hypothetical protein T492DRAFT_1032151 [Pavlovales sp. CCMP2436]